MADNNKGLRLLVVSNRLPVSVSKDPSTSQYNFKMSSGGLVAALSGLKKSMSFTWIGWPGKFQERQQRVCSIHALLHVLKKTILPISP